MSKNNGEIDVAVFAERLGAAMESSGLRCWQLADELSIGSQTVRGWLDGNRLPRGGAEGVQRVAQAVGVSMDYLAGREEYGLERRELTVRLNEILLRKIRNLVGTGLYGFGPADCVAQLVAEGIKRHQADNGLLEED